MAGNRSTRVPRDRFNQLFNTNQRAVQELQDTEIRKGRLIENVTISASGTSVQHKLGREFRGWFVVRAPSGVTIEEQATQSNRSSFVDLQIYQETRETGADDLAWIESSAEFRHTNGGRVEAASGGGAIVGYFPGATGSYLLSTTVYGENPSSNVRTVDNIALRVVEDTHGNTVTDLSTPTEPATTTSLEWSISADSDDLPYEVSANERVYWLIDPATGASTNVYVYGISWTWALAKEATVDLWVF